MKGERRKHIITLVDLAVGPEEGSQSNCILSKEFINFFISQCLKRHRKEDGNSNKRGSYRNKTTRDCDSNEKKETSSSLGFDWRRKTWQVFFIIILWLFFLEDESSLVSSPLPSLVLWHKESSVSSFTWDTKEKRRRGKQSCHEKTLFLSHFLSLEEEMNSQEDRRKRETNFTQRQWQRESHRRRDFLLFFLPLISPLLGLKTELTQTRKLWLRSKTRLKLKHMTRAGDKS